jgi:hypothetical protein
VVPKEDAMNWKKLATELAIVAWDVADRHVCECECDLCKKLERLLFEVLHQERKGRTL